MANMTRAEAVCAAQNILDLAEELREARGDRFPDNYYTSVTDQAQSMKERIVENAQFSHVTENMTGWFRKTWEGLRKWDRNGDFNDELFYGLSDVILELEEAGAPAGKQDGEGAGAGDSARSSMPVEGTRRPRGRERTQSVSEEVSPAVRDGRELHVAAPAVRTQSSNVSRDTEAMATSASQNTPQTIPRPESVSRKAETAEHSPLEREEDNTGVLVARLLEDIVRQREERISVTLSQFVARGVRVIDKSVVHHADFEHILKKTTSDRTQQLLISAYLAGKVAGLHDLASELCRMLKERD